MSARSSKRSRCGPLLLRSAQLPLCREGSPLLGGLEHLEDLLDHQVWLIVRYVLTAGHRRLDPPAAKHEPSLLIFDIHALLFILVAVTVMLLITTSGMSPIRSLCLSSPHSREPHSHGVPP